MENENAGSRSDTQDIQERGSVAPLIGSIDCCGGEPDRDFQSRGIDEFLLQSSASLFFFSKTSACKVEWDRQRVAAPFPAPHFCV